MFKSSNLNSLTCAYGADPFEPYTNTDCGLSGWAQQNNDCWLDSTLYAMFASKASRVIFAEALENTQTQANPHLKEIGRIISLYLKDINKYLEKDSFDENVKNCKQILKKTLTQSILRYNESLPASEKFADDAGLSALFTISGDGRISMGSSLPLMRVFQRLDPRINLEVFMGDAHFDCANKSPQPRMLNAIRNFGASYGGDVESMEICILSFDAFNFTNCIDKTRIATIEKIKIKGKNFELQGIVDGAGIHFRAWARCDAESGRKRWYHYDNQSHPGKERRISMPETALEVKIDRKSALDIESEKIENTISILKPKLKISSYALYLALPPMKKKGFGTGPVLTEVGFEAKKAELQAQMEAADSRRTEILSELSAIAEETTNLFETSGNAPENTYDCDKLNSGTNKMLHHSCLGLSNSLTFIYKKVPTAGGSRRTRRNRKHKRRNTRRLRRY